jgi:hypothetical protein
LPVDTYFMESMLLPVFISSSLPAAPREPFVCEHKNRNISAICGVLATGWG